MKKCIRS